MGSVSACTVKMHGTTARVCLGCRNEHEQGEAKLMRPWVWTQDAEVLFEALRGNNTLLELSSSHPCSPQQALQLSKVQSPLHLPRLTPR